MKGAILKKGEKYYTYLDRIFPVLENEQLNYNWLITDLECNFYPEKLQTDQRYIWLSGAELSDIVDKNKVQFIWGVLSAFDKKITLNEVLNHELPYADSYKGFWNNPVSIQHPRAEIEVVPFDSALVLFIAKNNILVERFMRYFPLSEDLESYNNQSVF